MKKYIKLLAVAMLTVLMCMSFCSCKELDEMRESQAFWGKTEETVYFRGSEYKLLPACEYLYVNCSNYGHITEKDVPVLLSESGDSMFYNDEVTLLVSSYWGSTDKRGLHKVWCRADMYDEVCRRIETVVLDRVCTWGRIDENSYGYILLPTEASDIIIDAVSNFDGTEGKEPWSHDDVNEEYNLSLCDETLLFVQEEKSVYILDKGESCIILISNNGDGNKWTEYDITKAEFDIIKQGIKAAGNIQINYTNTED